MSTLLNIVLVEPEIPANTGNIARTCVALGATLHLIKPLGFELSDKYLKRSAMDYWQRLDWKVYETLDDFLSSYTGELLLSTTKAKKFYYEFNFSDKNEVALIFGKETKGLPLSLLETFPDKCARIPMQKEERSLNLSNAVAIIAYEVSRQWSFNNILVD